MTLPNNESGEFCAMWRGHDNILADVRAELRNIIIDAVNEAREAELLKLTAIPEFQIHWHTESIFWIN